MISSAPASSLDYCRRLSRTRAPAHYLCCLILPTEHRERVLALLSLNAEMHHIIDHVRDEMMARFRFTWWRERLQDLQRGVPTPGQPVLEALHAAFGQDQASALKLVDAWEEHYPNPPQLFSSLVEQMLADDIKQQTRWQKAQTLAARYPHSPGWLSFRLWWV